MRKCLLAALVLASVTTACGGPPDSGSNPSIVVADADDLLPSDTAVDWVIYADYLVEAEFVKATMGEASQEEVEAGEGFLPRTLTFRILDHIWVRGDTRQMPQAIEIQLDGSTFQGSEERLLRLSGEPMLLEVGAKYVMPIVYLEKARLVDTPGWSTLSPQTIIPVKDGMLGRGDQIAGGLSARPPITVQAWGKGPEYLTNLLSETPLPDYAKPFMDLPASERLRQIALARK